MRKSRGINGPLDGAPSMGRLVSGSPSLSHSVPEGDLTGRHGKNVGGC
jgi:hypothetical protein